MNARSGAWQVLALDALSVVLIAAAIGLIVDTLI